MSEDVKPRQFWNYDGFVFKCLEDAEGWDRKNVKIIIPVIELEPTLQLMAEMAEAIINEARPDFKEEVLEKYRKFKESLR